MFNDSENGTCAAVGSFDSMHAGHMAVGRQTALAAAERGLKPLIVSCPKKGMVMNTEEEKIFLFGQLGIERFVKRPLPEGYDEWYRFMKDELIGRLGVRAVAAGECNCDLDAIRRAAGELGIELIEVETQRFEGKKITDAMVLEALNAGDLQRVKELCGHPYILSGVVMHGKGLGRTVGMPTANLSRGAFKILPPEGVYVTAVHLGDELFRGVTNIGNRPSVDDVDRVTIETNILDFLRDIYGCTLVVEVHSFIRGVHKFDGLAAVQRQVSRDIEVVREVLKDMECSDGYIV